MVARSPARFQVEPLPVILPAPMNNARVHVLVINWNGQEHLEACFHSLLASTYTDVAFILVDNGSEDDSIALVRDKFGDDDRVDVLACEENLGWSGGNNRGIKAALEGGADYVFLLNNDTAIAPDTLALLVEAMDAHPTWGAAAPRMVLFDQPTVLNSLGLEMSTIGAAWDRGIGRADGPDWHMPCPVVGACGGAAFLRCQALRKTGLLPEAFQIYLDDLDLCLRIWHAGFEVWTVPAAIVRHKFSATMGSGTWARHKYFLNTRNRFWILLRHYSVGRLLGTAFPLLVGECRALGRAVLDGAYWRLAAHLRAWGAALRYLPAARRFNKTRCAAETTPGCWPLLRTSPAFCPPVILPEEGWYPRTTIGGITVRPIAPEAWLHVPHGPLRVSLVNCYPEAGPARCTLTLNGDLLCTLESPGQDQYYCDDASGALHIQATSLFPPTLTGEPMDIAAWMQIDSADNPLV